MAESMAKKDRGAEPDTTTISLEDISGKGSTNSDEMARHAEEEIVKYILNKVPSFRELLTLREEGWKSVAGDRFFEQQRNKADNADDEMACIFFETMKKIAIEMQAVTGALRIPDSNTTSLGRPRRIMDMCMAPGGFLSAVLGLNPESEAVAFTLPVSKGGHKVFLSTSSNVETKFLDITMLAADMGVTDIPRLHPDAQNFLSSRQLVQTEIFDIVICDGQVLRTQERAPYRERRETYRLKLTQLVLALEHLQPGGTMVVLLHKLDAWQTIQLLYTFSKFSSLKLYKPTMAHKKRSSFYMVATKIQSRSSAALRAIEQWKRIWRAATFETDDEAFQEVLRTEDPSVGEVLGEFGEDLIRLGRGIWDDQAEALRRAPFIRKRKAKF